MLKLKIDFFVYISEFLKNITSDDDIADTLVTIIDRIIIDEYIKPSPVENSLPLNQKEELIYNKRNEILSMMSKRKIDTNYISSSQTSDLYSNI